MPDQESQNDDILGKNETANANAIAR